MNNMEEKLWDHIDGNCSAEEQKAINTLIAADEAFRLKYEELLALNAEFSAMELDEPPMAFAYNVMETIRKENAQQPFKAAINSSIIKGITIFFVFSIAVLLVYMFSSIKWTTGNVSFNAPANFKMPDIKSYLTKPVIQVFVFFDIILGLYLFDSVLRRKALEKHNNVV